MWCIISLYLYLYIYIFIHLFVYIYIQALQLINLQKRLNCVWCNLFCAPTKRWNISDETKRDLERRRCADSCNTPEHPRLPPVWRKSPELWKYQNMMKEISCTPQFRKNFVQTCGDDIRYALYIYIYIYISIYADMFFSGRKGLISSSFFPRLYCSREDHTSAVQQNRELGLHG